jgi:hypothetical protein
MRASVIRNAVGALLLGVPAGVALADEPPKLNVAPSCEAAARGSVVIGRDKAACMGDENAALAVLKQNWSKYASVDKTQCIGNVQTGGPASYVELLSCIEIMRDAKQIRNAGPLDSADAPGGLPDQPSRRRKHHDDSAVQ